MTIRPESRARARALQLLYAWETDGRPGLETLLPGFAQLTRPSPGVFEQAAALCNIDQAVMDKGVKMVEAAGGKRPATFTDFPLVPIPSGLSVVDGAAGD